MGSHRWGAGGVKHTSQTSAFGTELLRLLSPLTLDLTCDAKPRQPPAGLKYRHMPNGSKWHQGFAATHLEAEAPQACPTCSLLVAPPCGGQFGAQDCGRPRPLHP